MEIGDNDNLEYSVDQPEDDYPLVQNEMRTFHLKCVVPARPAPFSSKGEFQCEMVLATEDGCKFGETVKLDYTVCDESN